MVTAAVKLKDAWKKSYDQPRQHIKKQSITLPTKIHTVKAMVFPVVMWELDHKESWTLKNWCFWTVVLEKTLENPVDCKEIKPVNPKGNQSWIFIGRTDMKAEAPIIWPPDAKSSLEKTLMLADWRQEKGDNRGWDGSMASPVRWTRIWASSGSWRWTGKPGVLQSMGSRRV